MAVTPSITDQQRAQASLERHGKSFAWAARFLGTDHAENGARLYAICRAIDDMADDNPADKARVLLQDLRQALAGGNAVTEEVRQVADDVHELQGRINLSRTALIHLLDGVEQDLELVRLADEDALIRYAYHVAGTVGLMMCDVFGVDDATARRHAVDLGIGMQLTNIARDVLEDAKQGRRYVPATWLPYEPDALVQPSDDIRIQAQQAIRRVLFLADRYYASGRAGFGYLPGRARLAIAVAAAVYQAIGTGIQARDCNYSQGRVVVPTWRKVMITTRVLATPSLYRPRRTVHDGDLQRPLLDLISPHVARHG